MENIKIDSEEFYSVLWDDFISPYIVSTGYLAKHDDFIREITFDFWNIYNKDPNMTINKIARIAEIFFKNLFQYNPANKDLGEKFFE